MQRPETVAAMLGGGLIHRLLFFLTVEISWTRFEFTCLNGVCEML